jgi:hypothetical protein
MKGARQPIYLPKKSCSKGDANVGEGELATRRFHRFGRAVLPHLALLLLSLVSWGAVRHWVTCRRLAGFHSDLAKAMFQAAAFGGPSAPFCRDAADNHARLRREYEHAAWRPWVSVSPGPPPS